MQQRIVIKHVRVVMCPMSYCLGTVQCVTGSDNRIYFGSGIRLVTESSKSFTYIMKKCLKCVKVIFQIVTLWLFTLNT